MLDLNSVWEFNAVDGFAIGRWRVLTVCPITRLVIVIELIVHPAVRKPKSISIDTFEQAVKTGLIIASEFETPSFHLVAEEAIPLNHRDQRDARFAIIRAAVENPNFLKEVAISGRSEKVSDFAASAGTSHQHFSRLLYLYWKHGQYINALLPAYSRCGAPAVRREAGSALRGAPCRMKTSAFRPRDKVNVTTLDQERFLKGLKKHYLIEKPMTLSKTYTEVIEGYYHDELQLAQLNNMPPQVPSLRQFRYWAGILVDAHQRNKRQVSQREWALERRQLLGSSFDHAPLPGSCFEIDATTADIFLVSKHNRKRCIGRPTVYAVVDKASRMIVGLYVGLEAESWAAGRQALINTLLPKVEYCARFGVEISEHEWPCNHLPQSLLADRGNLLFERPEKVLVPLMNVEITPTGRGDMKAIVERRFRIFDDKVLHDLEGTTRGRPRKRGERDPKLDAKYTLEEITRELILEVLSHNSRIFDELAKDELLIREDVDPTPINCWRTHIRAYHHALQSVDRISARALLLPKVMAGVTSRGIEYQGMLYTCALAEEQNWFSNARNDGRWKVEARIDLDNSSAFYMRPHVGADFIQCRMLRTTRVYDKQPMAEVYYLQDRLKDAKDRKRFNYIDVEKKDQVLKQRHRATREQAAAPEHTTKKRKVANIADYRLIERKRIEIEEAEIVDAQLAPPVVREKSPKWRSENAEIINILNDIVDEEC
jgi:hypothetical protein